MRGEGRGPIWLERAGSVPGTGGNLPEEGAGGGADVISPAAAGVGKQQVWVEEGRGRGAGIDSRRMRGVPGWNVGSRAALCRSSGEGEGAELWDPGGRAVGSRGSQAPIGPRAAPRWPRALPELSRVLNARPDRTLCPHPGSARGSRLLVMPLHLPTPCPRLPTQCCSACPTRVTFVSRAVGWGGSEICLGKGYTGAIPHQNPGTQGWLLPQPPQGQPEPDLLFVPTWAQRTSIVPSAAQLGAAV